MSLGRIAYPLKAHEPGLIILTGTLTGGGSATNITVSDFKGVTGATRSALGRYTLVLPGVGTLNVQSIQATVESAVGLRNVNIRSYTPSTRTLVVDISDLATPTQVDLTTAEKLHLTVFVKDSAAL